MTACSEGGQAERTMRDDRGAERKGWHKPREHHSERNTRPPADESASSAIISRFLHVQFAFRAGCGTRDSERTPLAPRCSRPALRIGSKRRSASGGRSTFSPHPQLLTCLSARPSQAKQGTRRQAGLVEWVSMCTCFSDGFAWDLPVDEVSRRCLDGISRIAPPSRRTSIPVFVAGNRSHFSPGLPFPFHPLPAHPRSHPSTLSSPRRWISHNCWAWVGAAAAKRVRRPTSRCPTRPRRFTFPLLPSSR